MRQRSVLLFRTAKTFVFISFSSGDERRRHVQATTTSVGSKPLGYPKPSREAHTDDFLFSCHSRCISLQASPSLTTSYQCRNHPLLERTMASAGSRAFIKRARFAAPRVCGGILFLVSFRGGSTALSVNNDR